MVLVRAGRGENRGRGMNTEKKVSRKMGEKRRIIMRRRWVEIG